MRFIAGELWLEVFGYLAGPTATATQGHRRNDYANILSACRVCHDWHRVATVVLYSDLHLECGAARAERLLRTLREFASFKVGDVSPLLRGVSRICATVGHEEGSCVAPATFVEVVSLCPSLRHLDVSVSHTVPETVAVTFSPNDLLKMSPSLESVAHLKVSYRYFGEPLIVRQLIAACPNGSFVDVSQVLPGDSHIREPFPTLSWKPVTMNLVELRVHDLSLGDASQFSTPSIVHDFVVRSTTSSPPTRLHLTELLAGTIQQLPPAYFATLTTLRIGRTDISEATLLHQCRQLERLVIGSLFGCTSETLRDFVSSLPPTLNSFGWSSPGPEEPSWMHRQIVRRLHQFLDAAFFRSRPRLRSFEFYQRAVRDAVSDHSIQEFRKFAGGHGVSVLVKPVDDLTLFGSAR